MTIPTALPTAFLTVEAWLQETGASWVGQAVYTPNAPVGCPFPCVAWHSQDDGGQAQGFIGQVQWRGAITIRAFAVSQDAADALNVALMRTLPGSWTHDGARLQVTLLKPLPRSPTSDSPICMAAATYRVQVAGG